MFVFFLPFFKFSFQELDDALKICNYIFTLIFVLESVFKLVAFGFRRFFKDKSVFKPPKQDLMLLTKHRTQTNS